MSVKIVAITKPLVDGIETAEEFVAYAARVSNPSNQMNKETSSKLLRYCIKNKHWSVFEQVFLTLEVETTRDIGRQILRHRSFTFQEFSARYADPTKELGFVTREARLQDQKNRQNSIEANDRELEERWKISQERVVNVAKNYYNDAIAHGIAKEVARSVLPEGLVSTRMYVSGSLRSFIHWIDVRAEEGTQKEHRQVAIAARNEILKHFPSLEEYWFSIPEKVMDELDRQLDELLKDVEDTVPVKKSWWKFW